MCCGCVVDGSEDVCECVWMDVVDVCGWMLWMWMCGYVRTAMCNAY